ncbi:hypothetical protein B0H15DRAFT_1019941 [Mycena belliarum]|uniref:Capsule polysaccharide biosynthesis protein n=1 Tax=Mycena belliarum TaxID=1033014 RepID=A0AAD6UD50_9AGAR|nr:hypothetical protein B0H15DRAFT_1019941 [Mycena belliae]
MAPISIPPQYQDQLEPIQVIDTRTDSAILHSLTVHAPVTSQKNIWAFWHSGVLNMPGWCQRNVVDWVRICGPKGWTIRVLDNVPASPSYALKYLPAEMLPDAFVKGIMDGEYSGPHSADMLRGACLYEHGGVFMDVGSILFRDMDRICWDEIADPDSPIHIVVPLMYKQTIANSFVASRKGDPFIKRWHDLFTHLWKSNTNHKGLVDHPLMAPLLLENNLDESRASNFKWDFKVDFKTIADYVTQVMAWIRLTKLEAVDGDDFSDSDYWQNHVRCFDVLQESWGAEATLGFEGFSNRALELLSLSRDSGDSGDKDKQRQAEELVWRLLSKSSFQKITHGKGLTHSPALGVLWELEENEGKDCGAGTFAELMRYGSVHFRQKRASIVTMKTEKSVTTMKKGLLEP